MFYNWQTLFIFVYLLFFYFLVCFLCLLVRSGTHCWRKESMYLLFIANDRRVAVFLFCYLCARCGAGVWVVVQILWCLNKEAKATQTVFGDFGQTQQKNRFVTSERFVAANCGASSSLLSASLLPGRFSLTDGHTHPCSLILDSTFLMHKVPLKEKRRKKKDKKLTFFTDSLHFCNVPMECWLFQMPLFLCRAATSTLNIYIHTHAFCINRF